MSEVGWGLEPPDLVESVPAHGTKRPLRSLPTQFHDFMIQHPRGGCWSPLHTEPVGGSSSESSPGDTQGHRGVATELHNSASWEPGKWEVVLLAGVSRAGLEHPGFEGDARSRSPHSQPRDAWSCNPGSSKVGKELVMPQKINIFHGFEFFEALPSILFALENPQSKTKPSLVPWMI